MKCLMNNEKYYAREHSIENNKMKLNESSYKLKSYSSRLCCFP